MKQIVIACVLLLAVSICAYADTTDCQIGPDAILKISVYQHADLSYVVSVGADGYMSYPLLGRIKAGGLTAPELEKVMTEGLRKYIPDPNVNIFVTQYGTITVSGEVNKPGVYPLKSAMTVLEAISLAGGFTDFAAENDVEVLRNENGTDKKIKVRAKEIARRGSKSKDVSLKTRDIVFVPETLF